MFTIKLLSLKDVSGKLLWNNEIPNFPFKSFSLQTKERFELTHEPISNIEIISASL